MPALVHVLNKHMNIHYQQFSDGPWVFQQMAEVKE